MTKLMRKLVLLGAGAVIPVIAFGGNAMAQPDLVVTRIVVPSPVEAGQEVTTRTEVRNIGSALAPGRSSTAIGYQVDLVLSRDTIVPPGEAIVSTNFREDALLVGGRISGTPDLAPGASAVLTEGRQVIPADRRPGSIYFCARIDPFNAVDEANEGNNVTCQRIRISPPSAR